MNDRALAVIDCRADVAIEAALAERGFSVLRAPKCERLAPPVCAHPDMLLFPLDGTVFCHEDYAESAPRLLCAISERGYELRTVGGEWASEYPSDVRFNIASVGKRLLIGARTYAPEIESHARAHGYEPLRVRQGYAKCSTLTVSQNALVTSDPSIYKCASEHGIDALLIREGHVLLDGYSHGFIGGASGVCGDTVYLVGDLSLHPDGERISAFCKSHGKATVSLSTSPLCDIGTVLFF